jgi:hypothetical protein
MKRFDPPEPCEAAWDGRNPLVLRWHGLRVAVLETLEAWRWRSKWWGTPTLEGETREYWRVHTERGVLEVYAVVAEDAAPRWVVSAQWD